MKPQYLIRYIRTHISEQTAVFFVIVLLVLYCILFAFFKFQQVVSVKLDWLSLTLLIPIFFTDAIRTLIESFYPTRIQNASENIRKVTAVVPTYNGEKNIAETVKNLLRRLPPGRIIVSSNGSTDDTCEIAKKLGVNVLEIKKPVGKVFAINKALKYVKTEYTLILDDDTLVGKDIIPTSLIDRGYEGVAFRVMPVLENNWSLLQSHEYRKSMDVGRAFHNSSASVQTVSGAIGLFNTEELIRQVKHHTGEFSGEDLQRTLLIHLSQTRKGVVLTDSLVYTHVPKTFKELFNQRVYGWNPGFYANLGIYLQLLRSPQIPKRLRYDAFYTIFLVFLLDPLRAFRLPVLLFSPTFILIFCVTYIISDFVPYWRLGRKEPLWVVFVSPIYGLFNFITRFLAGAVFLYRRISYFVGRAEFYDGYRYVRSYAKIISLTLVCLFYILLFSSYSYGFVIDTPTRKKINQFLFSYRISQPTQLPATLLSKELLYHASDSSELTKK